MAVIAVLTAPAIPFGRIVTDISIGPDGSSAMIPAGDTPSFAPPLAP
ncbi:MAG: hypothetical protein ACLFRG_04910 [Desulfococcaceae bacterium]